MRGLLALRRKFGKLMLAAMLDIGLLGSKRIESEVRRQ